MIVVRAKSNGVEIAGDLQKKRNGVPFAVVVALTRTAKHGQAAVTNEMRRVFDRPTSYTLNSTYIRPATRDRLVSSVYLKDDTSKGTPAAKYLSPQIEGGARKAKRFEVALQRIGVLPAGWFVVPGKGAKLDNAGNWSRGQIVQVLSYFQAFGEQGYRANTTAAGRAKLRKGTRSKRGLAYFAVLPGRRASRALQPGIYQQIYFASGAAITPIAIFVSSNRYPRRLDFFGVVDRTARNQFPIELQRAMSESAGRRTQ